MPDADSERDRLLAEIGIDPLAPPPEPELPPAAETPSLPASPLAPEPAPPAPSAPPFRPPRRLLGALMAFCGAAWLGAGLADGSPSALAIAAFLLLPGFFAWLGPGRA